MNRPFPEWPDQAERERRAAKARRATLCLALVASILLLISAFMSGCVPPMRCRVLDGIEVCANDPTCRDTKTGRFIACPTHGYPVGSDFDGKDFYCRDAQGRRWLSQGECD